MIIYKITNTRNGKIYIGQTTETLSKRWKRHCSSYCTKYMAIARAISKYGKASFIIEEVEKCNSREELNIREHYYIYTYKTLTPYGYNIKAGGNNSPMANSTKQKISNANKGQKRTLEMRKKMSIIQQSLYDSNPNRAKLISDRLTGKPKTASERKSLSCTKQKSSIYTGVSKRASNNKKINYIRYIMSFSIKDKTISERYINEHDAAQSYDLWCITHGLEPINFPEDIKSREYFNEVICKPKRVPKNINQVEPKIAPVSSHFRS